MAARGMNGNYGIDMGGDPSRRTFKGKGAASSVYPQMSEDDANTMNNLQNIGIDSQTLNNVPNMIPTVDSGNRAGSLNQKDIG